MFAEVRLKHKLFNSKREKEREKKEINRKRGLGGEGMRRVTETD